MTWAPGTVCWQEHLAFLGVLGKIGWFPLYSALMNCWCWVLSLTRRAVRLTQKALCRFHGQEPFSSSKEESEETAILGILKRLYTGDYSRLVCLFPAFKLLLELDQNCPESCVSSFKLWASVYISVCMYSAVQSCTICDHFLM